MCKLYLKDAYFSALLHPVSRKFVQFLWSGKLYEFLWLWSGLGPSPRNFTKLLKISVSMLSRLNIYLDDMLIGHTIKETLMARSKIAFLLQQVRFVLNIKKSVLAPTQRMKFLEVKVDSLIKNLYLPEAVSRTSSLNKCINFRFNKANNRLLVFNYSSSTSSTIKFQVPATTRNTSIKNAGFKSDSKQKLQGRTAVVDTKIWTFAIVVTWFSLAVKSWCIQKKMGMISLDACQDISTGEQRSKEEHLL